MNCALCNHCGAWIRSRMHVSNVVNRLAGMMMFLLAIVKLLILKRSEKKSEKKI